MGYLQPPGVSFLCLDAKLISLNIGHEINDNQKYFHRSSQGSQHRNTASAYKGDTESARADRALVFIALVEKEKDYFFVVPPHTVAQETFGP